MDIEQLMRDMESKINELREKNKALAASNKELLREIESIQCNAEKINKHTFETYKEQILLHTQGILSKK